MQTEQGAGNGALLLYQGDVMAIKTQVILAEDGRFYQEKTTKALIDVDNAVIQEIISGFSVMIDNIIGGWSILAKGDSYTMFCNLAKFDLKTHFTPNESGTIVPTFADTGDTIDWCPTVRSKGFMDCDFWFGIRMRCGGFTNAYFVWRDSTTGKVCVPPLGNVYDDGKFCMGEDFIPPARIPAYDIAQYALKHFQETNWNSDLFSDETRRVCESMLQFNGKGNLVGDVDDWSGRLYAATHPVVSGFFDKLYGDES